MKLKDEYVAKLKTQLDDWSADIDELEVQANLAKAELRDKYNEHLSVLKSKHHDAKSKVIEIQNATEGAWTELKKGSDIIWDDVKNTLEEARKKFGK